jgi:hypothetical protein
MLSLPVSFSNGDTDVFTSELRASTTLFLWNTENLKQCEFGVVFSVETFIRNMIEICSVVLNMKHAAALSGRLDRQTWLFTNLFLSSITCKESDEESGKNYINNLPHVPAMAFTLLTKQNQVSAHLITSLDIYRLLTFLYNKIQNIVPLCQIPCRLYFRHYCPSKQHFRENSDITFYHFTNPSPARPYSI